MLAALFRELLERDERWRVCCFSDGQDAKDHLPQLGAHLILLDVKLPNLDGDSLSKMFRGNTDTKNTPEIFSPGTTDWDLHPLEHQTGQLLANPFEGEDWLSLFQALLVEGG